MAALDRVKEEIGYLKLWQGLVVVTFISMAAWVITASDTSYPSTYALAVAGLLLLSWVMLILHRRIERRIRLLEVV